MRSGLIDGVLLLTSTNAGLAWYVVRGYSHPPGYVIAQPYRLESCERIHEEPTAWVDCIGSRAWLVPVERVVRRLWPEDSYKVHATDPGVDEFLDQIGAVWRGLTGSRPLGCHTSGSDYDLLALADPGIAYKRLTGMRDNGTISQCKEADIRAKREARHPRDAALHPSVLKYSVTDSCYQGVPYTLRLLRSLKDSQCMGMEVPISLIESTVEIRPDMESILVPARYQVRLDDGTRAIVESWRTRYQGLPKGLYRVRGLLTLTPRGYVVKPDWHGYIAVEEIW